MSVRIIVACARCGKKYKGEPGARKFKCSACKAIFTFPEGEKSALPGKILCGNCWHPTPKPDAEINCPTCNQPIHPDHGGVATLQGGPAKKKAEPEKDNVEKDAQDQAPPSKGDAGEQVASNDVANDLDDQGDEAPAENHDVDAELDKAFASMEGSMEVPGHGEGSVSRAHESGIIERRVTQMVQKLPEADPERERLLRDLRELAEIRLDLESQIRTLENELRAEKSKNQGHASGTEAAVHRAEEAEDRAREAEAQLTQFRELAIQMLEPLGAEFRKTMQELIEEAADAPLRLDRVRRRIDGAADLNAVRDQAMPDLDKAEQAMSKLEKNIRDFFTTFGKRLSEVIGSDAE